MSNPNYEKRVRKNLEKNGELDYLTKKVVIDNTDGINNRTYFFYYAYKSSPTNHRMLELSSKMLKNLIEKKFI